jgi:hypothetical protein
LRKNCLTAIFALAVTLLCACAERPESPGDISLGIREEYLGAVRLVVSAEITADYGDRVYDFEIKYTGNAEAGEISVLSPEQVAGMTAEVSLDSLTLVYGGASLDTGALTSGGLSPAGALPMLISEWQGGHVEYAGREKLGGADTLAIETVSGEAVRQKTWFDEKTLLPLKSEISDGGRMVVACVFNNVIIE